MATISEEILTILEHLSPDYQRRVLEFAQGPAQTHQTAILSPKAKLPPGTSASVLMRFKLPLEDVEAIERALEDCEKVCP